MSDSQVQPIPEETLEEENHEDIEIQKQMNLPLTQEELKKRTIQQKGLISQFQNRFLTEQSIHQNNKKKVLMEWRVFVSSIKKEELQRELNLLSTQFQRTLDTQNQFLQTLQERLEDAIKQHDLTLKNHSLHVDQFTELRQIKMSAIQKNFERSIRLLQEEFESEYTRIMNDRVLQMKCLNDMVESIKEEEQLKSNIIKENFQQLKEETKDQTTEETELMQNEMNTKKVNIYNALENLFQKFMNNSKEKFKKYSALMETNAQDSKSIEETIKKISKTKNKIKLTSLKIIQMKKEFEVKNIKIRKENEEVAKNFLALKNKMFQFRDKERRKLTELVTSTKDITLELKGVYEQGERILKNTQLCRKLEFENEKVFPFISIDQEQLEQSEENIFSNFEDLEKYHKFRNMFKRYNKVLLDTLAFEKHNKTLKLRNKDLKNQLLQFMDGVTTRQFFNADYLETHLP